jgi:hypothetical protein
MMSGRMLSSPSYISNVGNLIFEHVCVIMYDIREIGGGSCRVYGSAELTALFTVLA